jgi:hypothetical protein
MAIHEGYFFFFVVGFCGTLLSLLYISTGERLRTWWILRCIGAGPPQSRCAALYNRLVRRSTAASKTRHALQSVNRPVPQHSLNEEAEIKIAILPFYINPTDDIGIRATYLNYRNELAEQDSPVFSAEVIFPGQRYPTEDATIRILATDGDVRQYRKRALSVLIETVPQEYEAVVWIDPGVKLLNPAWLNLSRGVVTHMTVARLFQMAAIVDSEGKTSASLSGELGTHQKSTPNGDHTAPASLFYGGAWAIRRSALPLLKCISKESPGSGMENHWSTDSCHIKARDALTEVAIGYKPRADVPCQDRQETRGTLPGHAIIRGIADRLT